MAVHAVDILESAQRVATLPQALGVLVRRHNCSFVPDNSTGKPRTALPLVTRATGESSGSDFGPEYRG